MDRRSFVKIAVGAGAGAVLAGTAAAFTKPALIPRDAGTGNVRYYGAHRIGGPAPRGVPLIPITIGDDGVFRGLPSFEDPDGNAVNALDWYKYCQHQSAAGLDPAFKSDNTLTYFAAEDKLKNAEVLSNMWFRDLLGQPVNISHFTEDYQGAAFLWRSEGQSGTSLLTGAIIRYPKDTIHFPQSDLKSPAKAIKEGHDAIKDSIMVTRGNSTFVGVSLFCTHFCCAPGWREAEKQAKAKDAWEMLFCTCHLSIYDVRSIVYYDYVPELAVKPKWPDTPE
ncbi:MAG TPA: hypothetical protein VM889_03145 [Candidatus Thermoplasmatota archaeon]|nr:hypothetical protein [Candidatus Thermoplasmatota archaeon]